MAGGDLGFDGQSGRSSLALEQSLQSRERLADASNKAFVAQVERSLSDFAEWWL